MEIERAAYTIRLQNIPEKKKETKEELTGMTEVSLAEYMEKHHEEIRNEIDCVSRVGNVYTKRNYPPREVHVKVVRQGFKEEIVQKSKKEAKQIQGQEINVLKEVPWRVKTNRKKYQKFIKFLQKNKIVYRWLIPEGVLFEYQGTMLKLNSTMKAEDFLKRNKNLWQDKEGEE